MHALGKRAPAGNYSEKYLPLSPYNYCMNNPMVFIDPTGDTTIFYNQNGGYLFTLNVETENAVTIINNNQMTDFFNSAIGHIQNGTIGEGADELSSFGDSYMVNDFWEFNDEWGHDEQAGIGTKDGETVKMSNEYGTYTYISPDGKIRPGKEAFKGTRGTDGRDILIYGSDNKGGVGPKVAGSKYAGKAHIHTDVGVRVPYLGTGFAWPSDDRDMPNSISGKYCNVVVSNNELWIYKRTRKNIQIRINRAPFKPINSNKYDE